MIFLLVSFNVIDLFLLYRLEIKNSLLSLKLIQIYPSFRLILTYAFAFYKSNRSEMHYWLPLFVPFCFLKAHIYEQKCKIVSCWNLVCDQNSGTAFRNSTRRPNNRFKPFWKREKKSNRSLESCYRMRLLCGGSICIKPCVCSGRWSGCEPTAVISVTHRG